MGGVHVENFRVGGLPADPRALAGFPPEYAAYFAPGGGGVMAATVRPTRIAPHASTLQRKRQRSIERAGATRPPEQLKD